MASWINTQGHHATATGREGFLEARGRQEEAETNVCIAAQSSHRSVHGLRFTLDTIGGELTAPCQWPARRVAALVRPAAQDSASERINLKQIKR